jgi:hypothetical protein
MSGSRIIAAVSLLAMIAFVPRAFAVEIEDLWNEYNDNNGVFNQKYRGKRLSVTGPILLIHTDGTSSSVTLRAGQAPAVYLGSVNCFTTEAVALQQSKGATVTVTGTLSEVGNGGMNIRACTVQ